MGAGFTTFITECTLFPLHYKVTIASSHINLVVLITHCHYVLVGHAFSLALPLTTNMHRLQNSPLKSEAMLAGLETSYAAACTQAQQSGEDPAALAEPVIAWTWLIQARESIAREETVLRIPSAFTRAVKLGPQHVEKWIAATSNEPSPELMIDNKLTADEVSKYLTTDVVPLLRDTPLVLLPAPGVVIVHQSTTLQRRRRPMLYLEMSLMNAYSHQRRP